MANNFMVAFAPSSVEPTSEINPVPSPSANRPWIEVLCHLDPRYGGLSAAVPELSAAVARNSSRRVTLAAFCGSDERFLPFADAQRPDTAQAHAPVAIEHLPFGRTEFRKAPLAQARFFKIAEESAGLHLHGLWQQATAEGVRAARRFEKPYVVSAHGMLEPWALRTKRLKKTVYAALFERSNLRGAHCLHALTQAEADDYRRFGLQNPIAVIPNGVSVPAVASPELFFNAFPELRGQRLVLFLARLHPKKGADLLLKAWAGISAQWPDAHLVFAGPDFENTRSALATLSGSLGTDRSVTFTGMLAGDMKWSALAAASCFVLPSHSEGLSVSVLEAMGIGLPVVITEQCHLPEVAAHNCGWTIQPNPQQIASALNEMLRAPASLLAALSVNSRRLVQDRYSWSKVGRDMASIYDWVGGGALPTSIDLQQGKRS